MQPGQPQVIVPFVLSAFWSPKLLNQLESWCATVQSPEPQHEGLPGTPLLMMLGSDVLTFAWDRLEWEEMVVDNNHPHTTLVAVLMLGLFVARLSLWLLTRASSVYEEGCRPKKRNNSWLFRLLKRPLIFFFFFSICAKFLASLTD